MQSSKPQGIWTTVALTGAAYRKKMACGVHLGILLICFVQAEHVRCLWAEQAQSSRRQNGNAYVGFSQQQSGHGRLASSYPQDQLRQASAQSRSFNTEPAASSSSSSSRFSQVYTSGGDRNPYSQPAQSGRSSVRLVQSSSLSKPNWRPAKSNHANAPSVPKIESFGLSTSIASGSSVSKYSKKRDDSTSVSKKSTWPVQQGTAHVGKFVSSSSAAVQSPRSPSAAWKAPSAAAASASYPPVKSTSRFSVAAPALQEAPVRMQTSATARARRVSKPRSSKPSRFSPSNVRSLNNPSQTGAGYQSKPFPRTGGNARGSQSLPASPKRNAFSFQPRSYASKLPAAESSGTGASGESFAPTRTHDIPDRFGGFAIRRLKEPADQTVSARKPQQSYPASSGQSASLKQRQAYPAPSSSRQAYPAPSSSRQAYPAPSSSRQAYPAPSSSRQAYPAPSSSRQAYLAPSQQAYQPQGQSVHHESKWTRVRPSGRLSAADITG